MYHACIDLISLSIFIGGRYRAFSIWSCIDEGYKGNRANSLTLDVLYPEVSNLRKSLLRNYNVLSITLKS